MSKSTDLARLLIDALADVPGLRPAQPVTGPAKLPWDADLMAVDVDQDLVTVRLVASQLPLPPLLDRAGAVLHAVLAEHGNGYEGVRLRLEVTDLDQAAFGRPRPQRAIRPPAGSIPVKSPRRPSRPTRSSRSDQGDQR
jgi:hypothetical protein